uniref:SJCHGC03508 protein n=1 Tax=Schistosoma japonicum TaxID=6182 RepID=Q5BSR0_SCHJA|nr:SJCHGC03508 protein [Schistosoma japonicum]
MSLNSFTWIRFAISVIIFIIIYLACFSKICNFSIFFTYRLCLRVNLKIDSSFLFPFSYIDLLTLAQSFSTSTTRIHLINI